MKNLFPISIILFAACSSPEAEELKNNKIILAEDVQTILPLQTDTSYGWACSDYSNAGTKLDQEKIFKFITKGVMSGKFRAYADYPNEPLAIERVGRILVRWDSTTVVEDPNHPGTFVSAPLKDELTSFLVTHLKFHETIEFDTVTNNFIKHVDYISLYRFKTTETGAIIGTAKIFDVKLNETDKK